jgi:hypothetical protein
MISYTSYLAQFADLTQNNTTANQTRGAFLINQGLRDLTTKFYLNEVTQNFPGGTVAGQTAYQLPYNIKELVDVYIVTGTLRYVLTEVPNAQFFDRLQFAQYSSNIPQYYWVFAGQINIFPTPATSAQQLTFRYKERLRDLSQIDYPTGTVSVTNLTNTITGSGTTWTEDMANRWIRISANTVSNTTSGDNEWYQIFSWNSATSLTLFNQYQGTTVTGGSYNIGEMPLLPEDYQVVALYYALWIYYTSIVPNANQAKLYRELYDYGYGKLDAEYGNKSSDVRIIGSNTELTNPNLYTRSLG